MKASVRESFIAISALNGKGLDGRSTACGRGNAVAQQIDSPGFCRVILNKHAREMSDLDVDAQLGLMRVVLAVEQVVRQGCPGRAVC